MGRWSQRRLSGGGPPPGTAAALIEITAATITGSATAELTYSAAVSAAAFDPGAFVSSFSGESGIDANQLSATTIELIFSGPINIGPDIAVDYAGSTPGVLTPQSIGYT